jgi:transketolase
MRKTFSRVAQDILAEDSKTMIFLGDIGVFAFRDSLVKFPRRVFNMGILEQSMIGISAGVAKSGFFPIVHTIAPFLVERAHEQLKIDFGYQELPGNFVSVGASFDYASLGGTHHAPSDVETLMGIPGFQICIPGHSDEFEQQLRKYYRNSFPTYYRLSEVSNEMPFIGDNQSVYRIEGGQKATIIAVGPYLQKALDSVGNEGYEILYINEISSQTTIELGELISNNKIFLIEPFYEGTLNRMISDALKGRFISIINIGVPRKFIHNYGSHAELENHLGLSVSSIRNRILEQHND